MLSHWMIKLLHPVFVSSLGAASFWLLCMSLASDKIRRSSPSKRAELFMRVKKGGLAYMNIPLVKSRYLIGRGPGCDILLKGAGIPVKIGELSFRENDWLLLNYAGGAVTINGDQIDNGSRKLLPGERIILYNFTIEIKEGANEGVWSDGHRQKEREK
jgi:hypothetical protein